MDSTYYGHSAQSGARPCASLAAAFVSLDQLAMAMLTMAVLTVVRLTVAPLAEARFTMTAIPFKVHLAALAAIVISGGELDHPATGCHDPGCYSK